MPQKRAARSMNKTPSKKQNIADGLESLQDTTTPPGEDVTSHEGLNEPPASRKSSKEEIINIRSQQKPSFVLPGPVASRSLHERLQSFLPELAQSNETLAKQEAKSMEDVNEEDQHIVMELGLGVLEERQEDDTVSNTTSSDTDEESTQTSSEGHLQKLLGQTTEPRKNNIKEVD